MLHSQKTPEFRVFTNNFHELVLSVQELQACYVNETWSCVRFMSEVSCRLLFIRSCWPSITWRPNSCACVSSSWSRRLAFSCHHRNHHFYLSSIHRTMFKL